MVAPWMPKFTQDNVPTKKWSFRCFGQKGKTILCMTCHDIQHRKMLQACAVNDTASNFTYINQQNQLSCDHFCI